MKGGADRTLIYLTIYAVQCLVKCENIPDKFSALREMNILATKQFLCPGDVGWPLGGLFPSSRSKIEGGKFCVLLLKYLQSKYFVMKIGAHFDATKFAKQTTLGRTSGKLVAS